MKIAEHVAFVAGGASGLGAATARMFAAGGGSVVVADRDSSRGIALASELGVRALFVETDVTAPVSVEAAVAKAVERFGRLDVAVNCAGIAPPQRILGKEGPMALEAFARVVEINLIGTFNVCRLAAAAMARNAADENGERGVIVNTSSIAAFEGQIGQCAYAASKAGVAGLTLPLARDLARSGIRAVAIAPGLFDTPLLAGLPQEARQSLEAAIPFPSKLGRPEQFADLVRAIVENPYLNGEVIRLDGALRMQPK